MNWSTVHRGDYQRMRKHLTIALLEAEALEPRIQIAFAHGELSAQVTAQISLIRLMLCRADVITRHTFDHLFTDYYDAYADRALSDRRLAESA